MPRYLPNGRVDTEWLRAQDVHSLAGWVSEVLLEGDPQLPDNPDEGHFYLADWYRSAAEELRSVFRDALLRLLTDMANNDGSEWRANALAGDRLLYLTGEVYASLEPSSDERMEVARRIDGMATSRALFDPGATVPGDLHGRLLQLLLRLNVRKPYSFWCQQVSLKPQDYIGVGLSGATRTAIGQDNPLELMEHCTENDPEGTRSEVEDVLEIIEIDRSSAWLGRKARAVRPPIPAWCASLLGAFVARGDQHRDGSGRRNSWATQSHREVRELAVAS